MWNADKIVYRNDDSFVRAYQGSELVWEKTLTNNIIYYTSSDNQVISPNYPTSSRWGANIVSNTYSDGQGMIVFDGQVTGMPSTAFKGKNNLVTMILPSSLTDIGEESFAGCNLLTSVNIPQGVTVLPYHLFFKCWVLSSIDIPSSVTRIEEMAFYGCEGLTSIVIPSGVSYIGIGAFTECNSITSIVIPNGVTKISASTFSNCASLSSVTLPSSLTEIQGFAFSYTSLSSIVIPSSVTNIGDNVFYKDLYLTEVIVNATVPPTLGNNVFDYNASGRLIKVPAGSVEAYKAASGWSTYANSIVAQ